MRCLLLDEYEQRGEVVEITEAIEKVICMFCELNFARFSVESWGVEGMVENRNRLTPKSCNEQRLK